MPLQVVPAVGPVLEQVLNDTHPLWHDGLSRENYARQWAAQLKTPWGQQHLDRVALVDGPHVMCSAKRYDLSLRIDGRTSANARGSRRDIGSFRSGYRQALRARA